MLSLIVQYSVRLPQGQVVKYKGFGQNERSISVIDNASSLLHMNNFDPVAQLRSAFQINHSRGFFPRMIHSVPCPFQDSEPCIHPSSQIHRSCHSSNYLVPFNNLNPSVCHSKNQHTNAGPTRYKFISPSARVLGGVIGCFIFE